MFVHKLSVWISLVISIFISIWAQVCTYCQYISRVVSDDVTSPLLSSVILTPCHRNPAPSKLNMLFNYLDSQRMELGFQRSMLSPSEWHTLPIRTICFGYSLCLLNAFGSTQSKRGARLPVRAATSLAVSPWLFFKLGSSSGCERSSSTVSRELAARQAKWRGVWPPLVTQLTGVVDSRSSATRTQFHLAAECKGVQPSSVVANGSAPWCRSNLTIWRWLL